MLFLQKWLCFWLFTEKKYAEKGGIHSAAKKPQKARQVMMTLESILSAFKKKKNLIECITLNDDLSLDQWTVAFWWHIQIAGSVPQYREKKYVIIWLLQIRGWGTQIYWTAEGCAWAKSWTWISRAIRITFITLNCVVKLFLKLWWQNSSS